MSSHKHREKKNCEYKRFDGKPCGKPLYDNEYCVFHSKDLAGKKPEFHRKFWEEFERQKAEEKEYDFSGFVFPGEITFEAITFTKDVFLCKARFFKEVRFLRTNFLRKADFSGAQFSEDAVFDTSQFSGEADFGEAQFCGEAIFDSSQFSGTAYFGDTLFVKEASFDATQFFAWVSFVGAQFSGPANFNRAKFYGNTDFTDIEFHNFNECDMTDTTFYNLTGLLEFIEKNKENFKYSHRTEFLPDNCRLILGEPTTARYPIISRKIKDDRFLLKYKKKHPKLLFLWWLFANCGRSFLRWAFWSLGIALLFAVIYLIIGPDSFKLKEDGNTWFSFFYYSFVTFTTLGFGDITPIRWYSEILVTLEVILGYIMLGGLVSLLANKLARRS